MGAGEPGADGKAREQRDTTRVLTRLVVRYRVDGSRAELVRESADISHSGMFVVTAEPPAPGTRLTFDLVDPQQGTLASGGAIVRWTRPDRGLPGKPGGMGLQFIELKDAARQAVARLVDRQLAALAAGIDSAPEGGHATAPADTVPWGTEGAPPGLARGPVAGRRVPLWAMVAGASVGGAIVGWILRGLW